MKNQDADIKRKAIRAFMARRGLNILSWCTKAKVSESSLRHFLMGRTDGLQTRTLDKLLAAVHITQAELYGDITFPQIPLVGYVGAGAIFIPIDDSPKGQGLEMLDVPLLTYPIPYQEILAVQVRGDSMMPAYEEDTILFYHAVPCDISKCLNKLCVVRLTTGEMYFKKLRLGSIPNKFNLESFNMSLIQNADVDAAFRVISMQPPK